MKIKRFNENNTERSLEDEIVKILSWEIYANIKGDSEDYDCNCENSDYELEGIEKAAKIIIEYLRKNYPSFQMDLDARKYNL